LGCTNPVSCRAAVFVDQSPEAISTSEVAWPGGGGELEQARWDLLDAHSRETARERFSLTAVADSVVGVGQSCSPRSARAIDALAAQPNRGMEPLWSPAGAPSGNQRQIAGPRKPLNQAKFVAMRCHQLPERFDGKKGVDGSSPSEGLQKSPANRAIVLPVATKLARFGVRGGYILGHAGIRGHVRPSATLLGPDPSWPSQFPEAENACKTSRSMSCQRRRDGEHPLG
jgi:hypothetical protein